MYRSGVSLDKQMSDSTALLLHILDITRTMRERALDSDWESVREREAYRQTLIERCFPLNSAVANPAQVADSIHEIIELDRSVMTLAVLAREQIEESFAKLKLGRQAVGAYTCVEISC
jgi:hypothetical protein